MGQFEPKAIRGLSLPKDVPQASDAANDHPDGAIFRAENGERYRLVHARWAKVTPRKARSNSKATSVKK